MQRVFIGVGSVIVLLVGYLLLWPTAIQPVAWSPSPIPPLTGIYLANDELGGLERIPTNGMGPEDLTLGPDDRLYAGLEDGRIIRFYPDRPEESETYVNTGGRPLGLKFNGEGELIVADGMRGLLSINQDRFVQTLTDSVGGTPLVFVNHLDVEEDGTVWFSDSSQRFKGNAVLDMMEGSATGRLLSYEPRTGMTRVHLEGLRFANGVSLGPDDRYVLVSETLAARVTRFWVRGERQGTSEVFIDGLPGYPDNIAFNGTDSFWVALPMERMETWENLAPKPRLRSVLMRLPSLPAPSPRPIAWVLRIDVDGNVVGSHQSRDDGYSVVTSVIELTDSLYLGSVALDSVARAPLPSAEP